MFTLVKEWSPCFLSSTMQLSGPWGCRVGTSSTPNHTPTRFIRGGPKLVRMRSRCSFRGCALTAPLYGVRDRRRAAATEAGAQARSPAGHRGRVVFRKSLRAVSGRNSGRWGGAARQAPSGPCDPCGRTVLLSHVTSFAFSVIATLPTLTRRQSNPYNVSPIFPLGNLEAQRVARWMESPFWGPSLGPCAM